MTESQESWSGRLRQLSLTARAVLLLVVFGVYFATIAPLGWVIAGNQGAAAAAFATGCCLMAGWIALIVTEIAAPPSHANAHVMTGMMIRMSLPLMAALFVTKKAPQLIDAGFAWYLIGAFLVGLLVETLLSVAQLQPKAKQSATVLPQNSVRPQDSVRQQGVSQNGT